VVAGAQRVISRIFPSAPVLLQNGNMRLFHALVLVLAVAGCTRSNGLFIGDDGGGNDGSCSGCTDGSTQDLIGADLRRDHDLSMPPHDLAGADLSGGMCAPANGCPTGPLCGNVCCGTGERCDNGQCLCGTTGKACLPGEICSSGGPTMGLGECGIVCCGLPGNPCPL
jgi:hypothetical protein